MRCVYCGREWSAPWWLRALIVIALLLAAISSVTGWQDWRAARRLIQDRERADSILADWASRKCVPMPTSTNSVLTLRGRASP